MDIEVAAFISALFAYGKVDIFKSFLEKVFLQMGNSPYSFVMEFSRSKDSRRFRGLRYRFNDEKDLVILILSLKKVMTDHDSLGNTFRAFYENSAGDTRMALTGLADIFLRYAGQSGIKGKGFGYLVPSPAKGSACKRLNMFLRWMVRDSDIDFGLWKGIPEKRLIIPLDTHIARIAGCLGLTGRKTPDWNMAAEVTESLKRLNPEDPLRYDFALCHQGISGVCRADGSSCEKCVLKVD
ncbi:MAG TPA: TIGR02757 family protein [Nitrospirae bacterium]|nr:TIGR02757 family protein [Nitrospirota bacterium]HDZ87984.1 TIGR02757 family protein [Nitrospirota bacterium]